MNYVRTTSVPKGQFKCHYCRVLVRAKDGVWQESVSPQVFICKPCNVVPLPKAASNPVDSRFRTA